MSGAEQLPAGWKWMRLGEVIQEAQSGFASGEREIKGVIQLRMNNVDTHGRLVWTDFIRVPADQRTIGRFRLRSGDVVFNNTNSTELVGKSALFEHHEEPVVFSNHFTRLRTNTARLEPAFLAFWLQQQWQKRTFEKICNRWIGQSAVKPDKLLHLEIPLPPLKEQRRIVALLTEQMKHIETAQGALQAQQEAVAALPAALLRSVFEGEEAKKWPQKRLGNVLRLRKEIVHPRDNPHGSSVFIGLEHIESGTGRRIGSIPVEMSELSGRKPKFYAGDIVYGYLRPYLNKLWLADCDGLCSVDQYVYEVDKEKANPVFVAWFMRSDAYLHRAPIGTIQSQLPRIRTEEVASVSIGLPELKTQDHIISELSQKMAAVKELKCSLDEQRRQLDTLPAALLSQAMSGQWSRQAQHQWKERRAAMMSYTVKTYSESPTYGHVAQQKVVYMAEYHIGLELHQNIRQLPFGPADFPALLEAEEFAEEKGWFRTTKTEHRYIFEPMGNIEEGVQLAIELLGDRKAEMDRLLRYLMFQPTDFVERVATLYEVWRSLLMLGQTPSDDEIVEGVLNWHDMKRRFAPFVWKATLLDMKNYRFVPRIEEGGDQDE